MCFQPENSLNTHTKYPTLLQWMSKKRTMAVLKVCILQILIHSQSKFLQEKMIKFPNVHILATEHFERRSTKFSSTQWATQMDSLPQNN